MKNLQTISDLGTIYGIDKLLKSLGKSYIFPKISFFALDYGIFRPEDSHFVLYNASIENSENSLIFSDNQKKLKFNYNNPLDRRYFNGNKIGYLKYDSSIFYIEFSTEDYFIEIYFNKNHFYKTI